MFKIINRLHVLSHKEKKWTKFALEGQSLCTSFSMRLTNTHQPFENVPTCTALNTQLLLGAYREGENLTKCV